MHRRSIALLGILGLAACGPSADASGSPARPTGVASTTAPATASSLPSVSPPPVPTTTSRWRIIPTPTDAGTGRLHDVTAFHGSLIAVGASDPGHGFIWSSPDGETWRSIAGSTPLDGVILDAVAVGDPGVVATGWNDAGAVALFSADGTSWASQAIPDSHPGSSIVSVAWRDGRFVGVGGGGEPLAAVSWTSADGRAWTRVSIVQENQQASLTSVAAGPDGFVAGGMELGHPATWSSPDGASWTVTDIPGSLTDSPGRIRYTAGHFFFPTGGDAMWVGTDGRHWTKVTVPGFGVGIFDVIGIPGGFLAVGRSLGDNEPGVVATAAADGTGWTLAAPDPTLTNGLPSTLAMSPDGRSLVGVGLAGSGEGAFILVNPSALLAR